MIPDEEVERVRDAADIVGIIGEYTPLKRVGADFRGPCPFHQGTHRNFSVSPQRRIFHCFVCGEGGDVFTFLQKRLGMDWPSAVRMVAEKTGIELRETRARRDGPDPREPYWELNAHALAYFQRILRDDARGQSAREYLAQREVAPDVIERFGLGFAPREPGLLRAHLASLGFDEARQLEAGLLSRREESDEPRPRFRDRLIFPIFEVGGRVAGFGGRLLGPGEPKYLNSPETPAFSKGKMLYGLNWARNAIRRAERVFLVEGYFDLVRLVVAGIEEVVAPLGTALTAEQAGLVTRYSKNVFLLYDADRAGQKATFRAGDELLRQGASVRVVSMPPGDDPDSFARKKGREGVERQVADAIDVMERKIQILERGGWFADLHRRRRAIDYLLPTIRAAADPVTRDMYIGRAAEASGVDRSVLQQEAGTATDRRESRAPTAATAGDAPTSSRPSVRGGVGRRQDRPRVVGESAERELVRIVLSRRPMIERVGERMGAEEFREPRYREIFEVLARLGPEAPLAEVAASLSDEAAPVLELLLSEPDAIQDVERTLEHSLARLARRRLEERNKAIQGLLAVASGDEKDRLVKEKEHNQREIQRLTALQTTI